MADTKSANPSEADNPLPQEIDQITVLTEKMIHRVKNPLATIQLRMGLLAEEIEKNQQQVPQERILKKILDIQQEAKRLQTLLDDFLCLTGSQHLELTNADFNEEVQRILRLCKPDADEKNIKISDMITPNLPTVRLNRDAFHQALINLLRNAIQAMKEAGGKLLVRTRDLSKSVALDVIDYGTGMDPKTITRIFEPFYSTKKEGSGLGLPIVQQIVRGHGGQMIIHSEIGIGTQFTIMLPIVARIPDFPPPSVVIVPKN